MTLINFQIFSVFGVRTSNLVNVIGVLLKIKRPFRYLRVVFAVERRSITRLVTHQHRIDRNNSTLPLFRYLFSKFIEKSADGDSVKFPFRFREYASINPPAC